MAPHLRRVLPKEGVNPLDVPASQENEMQPNWM